MDNVNIHDPEVQTTAMPVEAEVAVNLVSQLVIGIAALGVIGTVVASYRERLDNAEAALTGSLLVLTALVAAIVMGLVAA